MKKLEEKNKIRKKKHQIIGIISLKRLIVKIVVFTYKVENHIKSNKCTHVEQSVKNVYRSI